MKNIIPKIILFLILLLPRCSILHFSGSEQGEINVKSN